MNMTTYGLCGDCVALSPGGVQHRPVLSLQEGKYQQQRVTLRPPPPWVTNGCIPVSKSPSLSPSLAVAHAVPLSHPQASDSDYEEALPKHSFVNHYMSDPTYYNSWKRRPPAAAPHRYEAVAGAEASPHLHTVITTQSAGGVYTPAGPGARAPLTGFSSFV